MTTESFVRRGALIAVAIVVIGAAFAIPLLSKDKENDEPVTTLVGKAAPDFSLETVDGKKVSLSDLKGDVVVVDFWATWCPPCRLSLPHVQHLSDDKALAEKGLKILAVNVQEDKDTIQGFMEKNHYSFTALVDKAGSAEKSFLVDAYPTTLVVGRDGKVKKVWVGFYPEATPKELDEAVADALKEESPKK